MNKGLQIAFFFFLLCFCVKYFSEDGIFLDFGLHIYIVVYTRVCSLKCCHVTDTFVKTSALRQEIANILHYRETDELIKLFILDKSKSHLSSMFMPWTNLTWKNLLPVLTFIIEMFVFGTTCLPLQCCRVERDKRLIGNRESIGWIVYFWQIGELWKLESGIWNLTNVLYQS